MCESWLETQLPGVGRSTKENTPIASKTNYTGRTVKENCVVGSSMLDFAEDQKEQVQLPVLP